MNTRCVFAPKSTKMKCQETSCQKQKQTHSGTKHTRLANEYYGHKKSIQISPNAPEAIKFICKTTCSMNTKSALKDFQKGTRNKKDKTVHTHAIARNTHAAIKYIAAQERVRSNAPSFKLKRGMQKEAHQISITVCYQDDPIHSS